MMVPSHERVGQRFNWLTILAVDGSRFLVRCDCGAEWRVSKSNVICSGVKSCKRCGRERQRRAVTGHGGTGTPEHSTWASMIQRCTNPRAPGFKNYGGRGIRVCDRWADSFEAFRDDMGARPDGMSLDRIDVNGNYEPGNCRWATQKEQMQNTRCNVWVERNGERMTVTDWAQKLGISRERMRQRLRDDLPPDRMFAPKRHGVDCHNPSKVMTAGAPVQSLKFVQCTTGTVDEGRRCLECGAHLFTAAACPSCPMVRSFTS